jgi:hypothetical protein
LDSGLACCTFSANFVVASEADVFDELTSDVAGATADAGLEVTTGLFAGVALGLGEAQATNSREMITSAIFFILFTPSGLLII